MKTFHCWALWLLGSTVLLEPYQTAAARPAAPALIQGKTWAASPVVVEASLTRTGVVQFLQPLSALAPLTKTCRSAGVEALRAQTTKRFRALSIELTVKRVSGEDFRLSAMWMRLPLSPHESVAGKSRKVRLPVASGVPMLSSRLNVPDAFRKPEAWKTLPVTWSICGYPSAPNGAYVPVSTPGDVAPFVAAA